MELTQLTLAILALPFIGFVALGLWGNAVFRSAAGIVSTLLLSGAAVLSWVVAAHYFFPEGSAAAAHPLQVLQRWNWLVLPNGLTIEVGLLLDPAAVMMLIVVTGVSLLVHIFSLGYMKGESRYPTYFAYLSLFTFSMLGIVLSSNLFQIYMFWELVGLSSFLLISFYFHKPAALAASKKAFIVTRFADLGFLIGILILSFQGESLDVPTLLQRFTDVQSGFSVKAAATSFLGFSVLTWGLLLIFMGGAGKSAMFPLHIWLPDAMEGPTPVSALIHAATMVVAGVYLVARLFPLFSLDAVAMQAIALIGIFSAVLAAVIACAQSDLKRVLAYSTMSQIGFMMFSLGVARNTPEQQLGYTASLFHLFTHAFFKSLLFLAAGAIIHYVHSNDIFAMGGLRKKMPITHFSFLVACLAISGVPFFSGFFSKEEILVAAYQYSPILFGMAVFTSGLTAFYMFRLYFIVFWHKEYLASTATHSAGEGPWIMLLPLLVLTLITLVSGYLPFGELVSASGLPQETHLDWMFSLLPVLVALIGIAIAFRLYKTQRKARSSAETVSHGLSSIIYHKFYIDEIYLFITRTILFKGIAQPVAWLDKHVVDDLVNTAGDTMLWVAEKIKKIQSGKVQQYGLWFLGSLLALILGLFLSKGGINFIK